MCTVGMIVDICVWLQIIIRIFTASISVLCHVYRIAANLYGVPIFVMVNLAVTKISTHENMTRARVHACTCSQKIRSVARIEAMTQFSRIASSCWSLRPLES